MKKDKIILLIAFVIWVIVMSMIGICAMFEAWNLLMIIYKILLFLGFIFCTIISSIIFYFVIKEL
jgi:hypothetical protein